MGKHAKIELSSWASTKEKIEEYRTQKDAELRQKVAATVAYAEDDYLREQGSDCGMAQYVAQKLIEEFWIQPRSGVTR